MKIRCTLNGKIEVKEIPTSWDQVSFRLFLSLNGLSEDIKILGALLGYDEATMRKASISDLMTVVLPAIQFLTRSQVPQEMPKTILGRTVPEKLNMIETGRYSDFQLLLSQAPKDGKVTTDYLKSYCEMCSIITMPGYIDSTHEQKKADAELFMNAPCGEVLAIGNFSLLRWMGLNAGIDLNSRPLSSRLSRWRLALKIWRLNLVSTARYYRWKRRLGISGGKF